MRFLPGTDEFVAGLCAERDEAAAFVVLLKAEQQALREGVAADVERLAPDKVRMADSLARYTTKRLDTLAALGYPRSALGMHEWADAHATNVAGVAAWQLLQEYAAEARALNEANGKLIDLRLRHCRQALAALEQACGATTVYGPQGHTIAPVTSRAVTAV